MSGAAAFSWFQTHDFTLGLRRWDFEYTALPLEVPSWNWRTNSQSRVVLEFPRILADRSNKITIDQPYDGNLGLAVPGYGPYPLVLQIILPLT